MFWTARQKRRIAKKVDIGPNVLDEVVMRDDLLSQPVELSSRVHPCRTHAVEGLDSGDKSKAVGQRACLVG